MTSLPGSRRTTAFAALLLCLLPTPVRPQAAETQPNQVVVSGTVPDEATRSAILARARSLYGAERVVDQLGVGPVVAPPRWSEHVQNLMSPELRNVSRGQLSIVGNDVDLRGEVADERLRTQIASDMAKGLNTTYVVRNGLRVAVQEQAQLDATLANRNIEFEPGSSALRPAGRLVVDEMAVALMRLGHRRLEVIGHTDGMGNRDANMALSLARADSVRTHLVVKGVNPSLITTSGSGSDRPLATNDTAEGRARNRRIEFRIGG